MSKAAHWLFVSQRADLNNLFCFVADRNGCETDIGSCFVFGTRPQLLNAGKMLAVLSDIVISWPKPGLKIEITVANFGYE